MDSCEVHHPLHLKGAHEVQDQLSGLDLEQEILRGQSDLLAWLIGRGWSPALVGLPLRHAGRTAGVQH